MNHWVTGPQVVGQEEQVAHVSRLEDWRVLLSLSGAMGYSVGAREELLKLLVSSISPMRSSTKSQPSRSCHVLPVNMEIDHPRVFLSQPLGEESVQVGREKEEGKHYIQFLLALSILA